MSNSAGRRSSLGLKLPPLPHPPAPLPLPPLSYSSSSQGGGGDDVIHPNDTDRLHLLGQGRGGKVYKVRHRSDGKVYALKVIQGKHEREGEAEGKPSEMDILLRFESSPNVVACYSAAVNRSGETSLVLEYMDGGSLADLLDRHGTLSERHIAHVARQVLRGLAHLHANKIAHRDVKPSNLLLNRQLDVKIADFGVSSLLSHTFAACTSFVGTCAYMSPERFDPDSHGGSYCGFAADIWSLGLSLLECATGHFPFLDPGQTADWPSLVVAICYGEPPLPPPQASPQFRDFIMRCLQKDPGRRSTAAALLSHPFVARNEGVPADMGALLCDGVESS